MDSSCRIQVKVVPGSSRDLIVGWLGDALKIKVRAPAEKGRANKAVEKLLASQLQRPVSTISVVTGHTKALKAVLLTGIDEATFRRALKQLHLGKG